MVKAFIIDGYTIPWSYDTTGDSKLDESEISIWCKANDMKYENGKIESTIPYNAENTPEKFDTNKYSLENLKKRYPESEYSIDVYDYCSQEIIITHRQDNKKNRNHPR